MEFVSPAYLWLEIIQIIIFQIYPSDALPYTRGTGILRLLMVRDYLKNYYAMYTRLTRSHIRVELAFPAYLVLEII